MLPGEHFENGDYCSGCGKELLYEVLQSAAGYYIGTACSNMECPDYGPNSRETAYYKTEGEANEDLKYYKETGNLKNIRI
jgi:hypothetical protein